MLQKINIAPGFNKQVTATGGEGQWVSGDYVRFRYNSPEKIGGWSQLGDKTIQAETRLYTILLMRVVLSMLL